MRHLHLAYILLLLFLPLSLAAQDRDELKEQADEFFEVGDYEQAKELYSQLTTFYPKDSYYNYRLGACMLYVDSDKTNPLKYLEYAVSRPDVNPEAYFFMGMGYHYNYRFKDAIGWYERFKQRAGSRDLKKYPVDDWIEMAQNGLGLLVNLSEPQVFKKARLSSGDYYQAIRFDDEGIRFLKAPADLQSSLDKRRDHEPIMYRNTHLGLIFFTSYGDNDDQGLDLFMMRLGSDEPPVRLPKTINTPYDEGMAFLASNGKDFYFSSKGHNSMGGYDIFRCQFDSNSFSFSAPQNMDWAFNTPADDWIYAESEGEGKAYLASSRNSNAGRISVYTVAPAPEPVSFALLSGTFSAPNTKSARIVIEDPDNGNSEVAVVNSDKNTGKYTVRLKAGKKYRFVVEPNGSSLVHLGLVTIPLVNGVRSLGQEMSIVVEDETEKLIIKNDFDRSMTDEDRRLLAAQLSRSEDLGEEEPEPTFDKEAVMQGLLSLEQGLSEKAILAKKEAAIALAVANEKNELADQRRNEAEALRAEVEPSGNLSIDDQRKLDEANRLEKEAIKNTRESAAAYSLFSTLDDVYEETFEAGLATSKLSDRLSNEKEVSDEQASEFERIKKEYSKIENQDPQERAVQEVRELTRSKRIIAEEANREMENTYTSIEELQRDVKYYRNQAATTKDKSLKETFEAEAESLELEVEQAKTKYAQMQDEVARKVKESAAYQTELALLEDMLDGELSEKQEAPDYSDGIKSGLALEIQDSQSRSSKKMEAEGWTEEELFAEYHDSSPSQGVNEEELAQTEEVNPVEQGESTKAPNGANSILPDTGNGRVGNDPIVDSPSTEGAGQESQSSSEAQLNIEEIPDELTVDHLQNTYVQDLEDRYFFEYDRALSETDAEKKQEALDGVNREYIADVNQKIDELATSYANADEGAQKRIAAQLATLDEVRAIKNAQLSEPMALAALPILESESTDETGREVAQTNTNPITGVSQEAGSNETVQTPYGDFKSADLRAMPFHSGDSPYNQKYEEQLAALRGNGPERQQEELAIREEYLDKINLERASINYKIAAAGSEATRNILQSKMDKLDAKASEQERLIDASRPSIAEAGGSENNRDAAENTDNSDNAVVEDNQSTNSQTGLESTREPVDEVDRGKVPVRQVSESVVKFEDQLADQQSTLGSLRDEKAALEEELKGTKKKKDRRAVEDEIAELDKQIKYAEAQVQYTEEGLVVLRNAEEILRKDATAQPSRDLQAIIEQEENRLSMMAQDLSDFENRIGETRKKKDREAMRVELETDRAEYEALRAGLQRKQMVYAEVVNLENELGQANVAEAIEEVELPRVVISLDEVQVEDVKSTPEYRTYAAAQVVYAGRMEEAQLRYREAEALEKQGGDANRQKAAELRGEAATIEASATADLNRAKEYILAMEDEEKRQMVLAYVYYESEANGGGDELAEEASEEGSEAVVTLGEALEEEVFEKKDPATPVYTQTNPIPINPALPEGLVFKVQVGAFRNPIPQETFKGFAPINGETTPSGLTRYTAGMFKQLNRANGAKDEIRALGYSDAFVVAYYNGDRISIARARALMAGEDLVASAGGGGNTGAGTQNGGQEVGTAIQQPGSLEQDNIGTVAIREEQVREVNPLVDEQLVVPVNERPELFYTVQIGVFSKEVRASDLYNISPLNTDYTSNGYVRYSTGVYASVASASQAKNRIVAMGINDAFVTAYYKGQRIPVSRAVQLAATADVSGESTTGSTEQDRGEVEVESGETTAASEEATSEVGLPEIPSTVVVADGETYGVRVGPYEGEVPLEQASVILDFSYTGVEFRKEDDKSYYTLGKFDDVTQAQRLKQQLQAAGIMLVEIINRKE